MTLRRFEELGLGEILITGVNRVVEKPFRLVSASAARKVKLLFVVIKSNHLSKPLHYLTVENYVARSMQ